MLNFACASKGRLIILVSYGVEEEGRMAVDLTGVRRIYALMRLTYADDTFKVNRVITVPYQSVSFLVRFGMNNGSDNLPL